MGYDSLTVTHDLPISSFPALGLMLWGFIFTSALFVIFLSEDKALVVFDEPEMILSDGPPNEQTLL